MDGRSVVVALPCEACTSYAPGRRLHRSTTSVDQKVNADGRVVFVIDCWCGISCTVLAQINADGLVHDRR